MLKLSSNKNYSEALFYTYHQAGRRNSESWIRLRLGGDVGSVMGTLEQSWGESG